MAFALPSFRFPKFTLSPSQETALRSALVFSTLVGLAGLAGSFVAGTAGIYLSLGASLAMTGLIWYFSKPIVLWLFDAKEVRPGAKHSGFDLHAMVEKLKNHPEINIQNTPTVCVIDSKKLNAFATGRNLNNAAIAITTGLLEKARKEANGDEAQATRWIEAIWCHELGHLVNSDIAINSTVSVLAAAVRLFSQKAFEQRSEDRRVHDRHHQENPKQDTWAKLIAEYLVFYVVIPIGASLAKLALSRAREFAADDMAAKCGYAKDLEGAFEHLLSDHAHTHTHSKTDANDASNLSALSNLMCLSLDNERETTISNGLKDPNIGWGYWSLLQAKALFSTHPPLEDRIERLRKHCASTPSM